MNNKGKGVGCWLILFALTWVVGVLGMVLASFFFVETGAIISTGSTRFRILHFLLSSLFLSGIVTLVFRPAKNEQQPAPDFSVRAWAWKLPLVLPAYPLIYITFSFLVQSFVMDYYTQGMYKLTTPT
jgi:hypothetical protein